MGRREHGVAGLGLLAGLAHHGLQAAAGPDLLGGRTDLRRPNLLARVRLDGRRQGRAEDTSRYLRRYLGPEGVRVNLVAAGPLETLAKKAIGGAEEFGDVWATGRRSAGTRRT